MLKTKIGLEVARVFRDIIKLNPDLADAVTHRYDRKLYLCHSQLASRIGKWQSGLPVFVLCVL